jgi:hypothetical protein
VARRHLADLAPRRQLAQPIEREGQVGVLQDPGVVEGLAAVVLGEGPDLGVAADDPVGEVAALHAVVERGLSRRDQTARGHQGDPAPCERLAEGRVRHGVDPTPGIGLQDDAEPERKVGDECHASLVAPPGAWVTDSAAAG